MSQKPAVINGSVNSWPVSPFSSFVALLALVLAAVIPGNGLGFSICWFRFLTGIPCPGCGLMRSLSSILRLDFTAAVSYHPVGPVIFVVFVALAAAPFVPERIRKHIAGFAAEKRNIIMKTYYSFVAVFLFTGFVRLGIVAGNRLCELLVQ